MGTITYDEAEAQFGKTVDVITANDAKVHFGETLMKAQRAPIKVTRNGKPVAVIVSIEDFEASEEMKHKYFMDRVARGDASMKAGRVVDGKAAFERILSKANKGK